MRSMKSSGLVVSWLMKKENNRHQRKNEPTYSDSFSSDFNSAIWGGSTDTVPNTAESKSSLAQKKPCGQIANQKKSKFKPQKKKSSTDD